MTMETPAILLDEEALSPTTRPPVLTVFAVLGIAIGAATIFLGAVAYEMWIQQPQSRSRPMQDVEYGLALLNLYASAADAAIAVLLVVGGALALRLARVAYSILYIYCLVAIAEAVGIFLGQYLTLPGMLESANNGIYGRSSSLSGMAKVLPLLLAVAAAFRLALPLCIVMVLSLREVKLALGRPVPRPPQPAPTPRTVAVTPSFENGAVLSYARPAANPMVVWFRIFFAGVLATALLSAVQTAPLAFFGGNRFSLQDLNATRWASWLMARDPFASTIVNLGMAVGAIGCLVRYRYGRATLCVCTAIFILLRLVMSGASLDAHGVGSFRPGDSLAQSSRTIANWIGTFASLPYPVMILVLLLHPATGRAVQES